MDTFKNVPNPQDVQAAELGRGLGGILMNSLKESAAALGMDDLQLSMALTNTISCAVSEWLRCLKKTGQEANAQKWFTNLLQCLSIVSEKKLQIIERD